VESLTDFASFPEWNPFIRRISGPLEVGARVDVFLAASGARGTRFRPTVKKIVPDRELRFGVNLGIPGLFDAEHIFELESAGPNRVRFVQRALYRGLCVPLFAGRLDRDVRRGFEEMNRALRARVAGTPA